jgi:MarR family transcriptional regulator, organic hydroperoxide resistance regulator
MDDTWELLMDLVMAERARIPQIAAEFRLSPPQVHALRVLSPEQPLPMGRLACALGCDASNVTGIVDRLEARGLVERRSAEGDRRVKALTITPAGLELREVVLEIMSEPPEAIAALPQSDQRTLRDILARAVEILRED